MPVSDIDRHLGQRIREARAAKGLSREELAELIESLGNKVQAMEEGHVRVSSLALARISLVLDVSLAWFYDGLPGQDIFANEHGRQRSV